MLRGLTALARSKNNRSASHSRNFEDPLLNSALLRGLALAACALALTACNKPATAPAPAASPAAAAGAAGMNDDQKTLYTMGFIAGGNFSQFKRRRRFTP